MIRRLVVATLLSLALIPTTGFAGSRHPKSAAASSAQLAQFDSEVAAQAHCPRDQVVWLNTNSGIYHEKGMWWYGRTKHGAYVCRAEADAAGDRDTRNGQ